MVASIGFPSRVAGSNLHFWTASTTALSTSGRTAFAIFTLVGIPSGGTVTVTRITLSLATRRASAGYLGSTVWIALGGVVFCGPCAKRTEQQLNPMRSVAPKQCFTEVHCISEPRQPSTMVFIVAV